MDDTEDLLLQFDVLCWEAVQCIEDERRAHLMERLRKLDNLNPHCRGRRTEVLGTGPRGQMLHADSLANVVIDALLNDRAVFAASPWVSWNMTFRQEISGKHA